MRLLTIGILIFATTQVWGQDSLSDAYQRAPELSQIKELRGKWRVASYQKAAPGLFYEWNYTQGKFPRESYKSPHFKGLAIFNWRKNVSVRYRQGFLKKGEKFKIKKSDRYQIDLFKRFSRRHVFSCRLSPDYPSQLLCQLRAGSGRVAYYCLVKRKKRRASCVY